jgi:hypothetical protein
MKLLSKPTEFHPEFVALQSSVNEVEGALQEAESLLCQKKEAQDRLRGHRTEPHNAMKLGQWHKSLGERRVELCFIVYLATEAVDRLQSTTRNLKEAVEKARQVYSGAPADPPIACDSDDIYHGVLTNLKIACGLNVLKSDNFRSSVTEFILKARKELGNVAEEQGIINLPFVAQQMTGNRRQFTVRFTDQQGQIRYLQADQCDDWVKEIPAVPCMTQEEARTTAIEVAKRYGFNGHSPTDRVKV